MEYFQDVEVGSWWIRDGDARHGPFATPEEAVAAIEVIERERAHTDEPDPDGSALKP